MNPLHPRATEGSGGPEKQHLFEARTGGYHVFRIPGIVATRKGTVLMHCDGRLAPRGQAGVLVNQDWAPIDILGRRSLDHGKTWEPARVLVDHRAFESPGRTHGRGHATVNNFTTLAEGNRDRVHAVYCVDYRHCFHMYSDDEGLTFSPPVEITATFESLRPKYDWNIIAVGPGHGLQLRSGRLLFSAWISSGGETHRPSAVTSLYSDDGGTVWRAGDILAQTDGRIVHPSETALAQSDDGHVLFNIRSESPCKRRLVSTSPDGATGWTPPRFDEALVEPACMASLLRLPEKGGLVFTNPVPRDFSKLWYGRLHEREQLTLRISLDQGRTWAFARILEEGFAGYSDLAATRDGCLLCAYESGRLTGLADDRYVTLARFRPDWIKE
jgi:sialidase-1